MAEKIGISCQNYSSIERGKGRCLDGFYVLVAVFQNSAETCRMLSNVEVINDELTTISAEKDAYMKYYCVGDKPFFLWSNDQDRKDTMVYWQYR